MSDVFTFLGVRRDAGERDIKRAYARLLRQHRPDEDPVGFQRLNEAYQHALACAAHRAMSLAEGSDDDDDPAPIADGLAHAAPVQDPHDARTEPSPNIAAPLIAVDETPARVQAVALPAPAPPAPVIDIGTVVEEVLAQAGSLAPSALRARLMDDPALYALSIKRQVGNQLFHRIAYDDALVRADSLAVLSDFFSIDPPQWLEQRLLVRLAVQNEDTARYDEPRKAVIRQLKRRFRWPVAALMACVPGMATRVDALAGQLRARYGEDVPGLNPQQIAFFARIAHPLYFGRWRWVTFALMASLAALLAGQLTLWVGGRSQPPMEIAGYAALTCLAVLLVWHGMRALWALQARPATGLGLPLLPTWLSLAAILADIMGGGLSALAYLLVAPASLIRLARFYEVLRFGTGIAFLVGTLPAHWPAPSTVIAFLAGASIAMNLGDLLYTRFRGGTLAEAAGNRWTRAASWVVLVVGSGVAALMPLLPLWINQASSDLV